MEGGVWPTDWDRLLDPTAIVARWALGSECAVCAGQKFADVDQNKAPAMDYARKKPMRSTVAMLTHRRRQSGPQNNNDPWQR